MVLANMIDDLVKTLKAVGEPTRLRALWLLSQADLSVGELGQLLGQSQPGVSRHLKFLTDAGLIVRIPEGAFVYYRLPSGDGAARRSVDTLLSLVEADTPELCRDRERLNDILATRSEAAQSYFDQVASDWDALRSLHYPSEKIEQVIRDMAGPGPFGRVIDVGTGTGRMLSLFADRAESAEGIDLSHGMLTVARDHLAKEKLRHVSVRRGDAADLPFEDKSADLVIIHHVLHFLEAPRRAIAEAARIIRPGGRVIVVDFAPHTLEVLRTAHAHRHLGIDPAVLADWAQAEDLTGPPPRRFDPPGDLEQGLSVLIWSLDRPASRRNAPPHLTEKHDKREMNP